jgi:hypothetical protein
VWRVYDKISSILTLAGMATAIAGILGGEAKPIGIGLVLILGGVVFARLHVARHHNSGRATPLPGFGSGATPPQSKLPMPDYFR